MTDVVESLSSDDNNGSMVIQSRCDAAAPLVVNGAAFVGCQLPRDHDGNHKVEVIWAR